MNINTILKTKDGRRVGNGIIIRELGGFYTVKTDYGNEMRLNEDEINELFYIDDSPRIDGYEIEPHKHAVKWS